MSNIKTGVEQVSEKKPLTPLHRLCNDNFSRVVVLHNHLFVDALTSNEPTRLFPFSGCMSLDPFNKIKASTSPESKLRVNASGRFAGGDQ